MGRSDRFAREARAEAAKLRQSLRRLTLGVERAAAPAAVLAAAEVLRDAVVREAPKDTGFLAAHVAVVSAGGGVLNVQVGAQDFAGQTFYAAMVEYGTAFMPADPFMRRALDRDGPRALRAAEAAFARAASPLLTTR